MKRCAKCWRITCVVSFSQSMNSVSSRRSGKGWLRSLLSRSAQPSHLWRDPDKTRLLTCLDFEPLSFFKQHYVISRASDKYSLDIESLAAKLVQVPEKSHLG